MEKTLGDRIKKYEGVTRSYLPNRSYVMLRIDGKAFHTWTKGLIRPFDDGLMEDMDATAAYLCKHIQGAKFAFVQSDEISILLTDIGNINSDLWFDGNIQKIASIAASMATSSFNRARMLRYLEYELYFNNNCGSDNNPEVILKDRNLLKNLPRVAEFDARVFQLPNKTEVFNYIHWRQTDTTRNSISAVAQSLYSHKELHGKNTSVMQEMIFQKGINWNDYAPRYKRGRMIIKEQYEKGESVRNRWVPIEVPIFTQERDFLLDKIPAND